MVLRYMVVLMFSAGILQSGFSQTISFNTPLPWVSLRNDKLTVRAQVDTAQLKNRKLKLTVSVVKNGRSHKLASKQFSLTDPSGEYSFSSLKKKLIGGEEYIKIEWAISGKKDKGTIEPIGIADLSRLSETSPVTAVKVDDGIAVKDVAAKITGDFNKTASTEYAFAWNKTTLFIVIKKETGDKTIKFGIDGKSGKNAFLSYPDRFVMYTPADSTPVKGIHFEREVKNDSLKYKELDWRNEITSEESGETVVIAMPWYDAGMISFDERTVGFGIFVENDKGKTIAALPKKADDQIPATWGILKLNK
jgi:hypothetical protein